MTTVAHVVGNLHVAARLIAPERDWAWLACLTARLAARAEPLNRFDHLVPGWQTQKLDVNSGSGGGTRTPDTRIMIPLL